MAQLLIQVKLLQDFSSALISLTYKAFKILCIFLNFGNVGLWFYSD